MNIEALHNHITDHYTELSQLRERIDLTIHQLSKVKPSDAIRRKALSDVDGMLNSCVTVLSRLLDSIQCERTLPDEQGATGERPS